MYTVLSLSNYQLYEHTTLRTAALRSVRCLNV
jgi:hypothetical protein